VLIVCVEGKGGGYIEESRRATAVNFHGVEVMGDGGEKNVGSVWFHTLPTAWCYSQPATTHYGNGLLKSRSGVSKETVSS
jgi:hypothetical protein